MGRLSYANWQTCKETPWLKTWTLSGKGLVFSALLTNGKPHVGTFYSACISLLQLFIHSSTRTTCSIKFFGEDRRGGLPGAPTCGCSHAWRCVRETSPWALPTQTLKSTDVCLCLFPGKSFNRQTCKNHFRGIMVTDTVRKSPWASVHSGESWKPLAWPIELSRNSRFHLSTWVIALVVLSSSFLWK